VSKEGSSRPRDPLVPDRVVVNFIPESEANSGMVEVETDCVRRDGVTYVRATLLNTRTTSQAVRIRATLSPVWAPKSGPVTSGEWSETEWARVLGPGQRVGLGYASPAEPTSSPVEVLSVERASDEQPLGPEQVLTGLEDASPPADVVSRDR